MMIADVYLYEIVDRAGEVISVLSCGAGSTSSVVSWFEDLTKSKLSHTTNVHMRVLELSLQVDVHVV